MPLAPLLETTPESVSLNEKRVGNDIHTGYGEGSQAFGGDDEVNAVHAF